MTPNESLLDEVWEESPVRVRDHSRLYALNPIGLGTPLVESLTSYVMRLADAHSLTPMALLSGECLPSLRPSFYEKGKLLYCHLNNDWWQYAARTLNGLNQATWSWVTLLERLTLRKDLSHLTLLPWQPVLSSRGLMRYERAWCPQCYADWETQGHTLYDPLLWTLQVITHCPQHGCQLQTRCPNPDCGRSALALHARGQPGYCPYCSRSLGRSGTVEILPPSNALWIASQVGPLLTAHYTLAAPATPQDFRSVLRQLACVYGGIHVLARRIQTKDGVVHHWLNKSCTWQLTSVLRISAMTGIPALGLLTGSTVCSFEPHRDLSPILATKSLTRPQRRFDRAAIQAALEAVLNGDEYPPPSAAEVGRRLGYPRATLEQHLPELCAAISARYTQARSAQGAARLEQVCNEVKQAVLDLHERGIYPSGNKVNALLGRSVLQEQTIYRFFKHLRQELGYH